MKKYLVPGLQLFANGIVTELETCSDIFVDMFLRLGFTLNIWCVFYDVYLD